MKKISFFFLMITLPLVAHVDEMKGLYLVLQKWQPKTQVWTRPFYTLPKEAGVLIISQPRKSLSPREKKGLDAWIEGGGMVVVMDANDWRIEKTGYDSAENVRSFRYTYGFEEQVKEPTTIGNISFFPHAFTNNHLLKNPEEASPLVQKILEHGGPIYFDRYHKYQGEDLGLFQLLQKFLQTSWGLFFLQLSAAFLLSLFFLKRGGLKEERKKEQPEKFILSRGLFLQSAKAKTLCEEAITKYREQS